MLKFALFSLMPVITIAAPLAMYRYSALVIAGAALAEVATMGLLYGSSFITCGEQAQNCGASWAIPAISLSFVAMNVGMIWPILGGYAKRAALELEENQLKGQSDK